MLIRRWLNGKKWDVFYKKWRKMNEHNFSDVQTQFDTSRVHIGKHTYGMINPHLYENIDTQLIIGSFCSISENVHFVFSEHYYKRFSTYPFSAFIHTGEKEIPKTKGDIVVEDDVWIGMNCTILSGVTIHQGAVVGAGSVITKDVPPYAIFAGNKVVKYRFDQSIIDQLLKIDFSKLSDDMVKEYIGILEDEDVNVFLLSDIYQKLIK